jgi:hypothetical protein
MHMHMVGVVVVVVVVGVGVGVVAAVVVVVAVAVVVVVVVGVYDVWQCLLPTYMRRYLHDDCGFSGQGVWAALVALVVAAPARAEVYLTSDL